MSVSYVITQSVREGNNTVSYAVTKTADGQASYSGSVVTATTNQEVSMAFTTTNVVAIYLYSSTDLTVKSNSSGSPDDTITLDGGVPLVWIKDSGITCPFAGSSGAITKLYITNASGSTATVEFRVLKDVTP